MAFKKLILVSFLFLFSSTLFIGATEQDNSYTHKADISLLSKKIGLPFDYIAEYNAHLSLYTEAVKWLGVRYRRSGMTAKGMDCSGLTSVIYQNVFNKSLVRTSAGMSMSIDEEVAKENLKPGDLVFFATRGKKRVNHVGVFLGDKLFIHASCGKGVIISSLDEPYYLRSWKKGGRMAL